jgi:IclR family pca regulon transcriptional regulator
MSNVIEKTFRVLERMRGGRPVRLAWLAETTRLDKGSVCNMLKTLAALGYVEKVRTGQYRLTEKLAALGQALTRETELGLLCEEFAGRLAQATEESGVVAVLRGDRVAVLAQAQHPRRVMVSISHYRDLSLYRSVCGRALLAHVDAATLARIVEHHGPPGADWDGIKNLAGLTRAAAALRVAGLAAKDTAALEISSFAVPVCDAEGRICAALGLTVPIYRMTQGMRARLIATLTETGGAFEAAVRERGFAQVDFAGIEIDADREREKGGCP